MKGTLIFFSLYTLLFLAMLSFIYVYISAHKYVNDFCSGKIKWKIYKDNRNISQLTVVLYLSALCTLTSSSNVIWALSRAYIHSRATPQSDTRSPLPSFFLCCTHCHSSTNGIASIYTEIVGVYSTFTILIIILGSLIAPTSASSSVLNVCTSTLMS